VIAHVALAEQSIFVATLDRERCPANPVLTGE